MVVSKPRIDQYPVQDPLPPHDYEAEETVLGACMVSREALSEVRDLLEPADFQRTHHGNIWAACCRLFDAGEPVNHVSVGMALKDAGVLGDSPLSYLMELTVKLPSPDGMDFYAGILREKRQRRDLISAAAALTKEAYSGAEEIANVISNHERVLSGILNESDDTGLRGLGDVLDNHYGNIRARLENPRVLGGISTGFRSLDLVIDGLKPTQLYVLGGGPGSLKTAMASHISENVALQGHRVAFFSMEMGENALLTRMLFKRAELDFNAIRSEGKATAQQLEDFDNAYADLMVYGNNFLLSDRRDVDSDKARRWLQREARNGPIDLVVFDYLHLMRIEDEGRRHEQIKKLMDHIAAIAHEFNCAALILSQLNRDSTRSGNVEQWAFYEGAAIEQRGDTQMILKQVAHPTGQDGELVVDPTQLSMKITKNKSGGPSGQWLRFNVEPSLIRITDPTDERRMG